MKTLIIYASKHGCTEKCSRLLMDKLNGEVKIVDIKKESVPELALFDNIIIGGSVYIGKIQKEVKQFCLKNISALKKKKLGFFICCMSENDIAEKEIDTSFPEELLTNAVARGYFGGEFIFKKMNVFEKIFVKNKNLIEKIYLLINLEV